MRISLLYDLVDSAYAVRLVLALVVHMPTLRKVSRNVGAKPVKSLPSGLSS